MIDIENIKATYPPEIGLVILLCRLQFGSANYAEVNSYILENKIDWPFFYTLVKHHDIRPLIYKVIIKGDINIDKTVLNKIQANVMNLSKANIARFRELLRLHDLFRENKLEAVPVKGTILSHLLYSDLISRETCDIDYLILASSLPAARAILLAEGYVSETYFNEAQLPLIIANSREHNMHRDTENGRISIELQWQVTLNNVDVPIRNEELLRDLDSIEIAERKIDVLNMHNRLLVLIAHHGVNDIWRNLKHILDVGILYKQYGSDMDWQFFEQEVTKYKLKRTAQVGFLISHQLFGTEVPLKVDKEAYKIAEEVMHSLLKFPLISRKRSFLANLDQQLIMRDSMKDKISVVLAYIRFLLAPDMRDIERVFLNRRLQFLYVFLKPLRMIRKAP